MFFPLPLSSLSRSLELSSRPPSTRRGPCNVAGILDSYKNEVAEIHGGLGNQYYSGQATVQSLTSGFDEVAEITAEAEQRISRDALRRDVGGDVDDLSSQIKDLLNEGSSVLGNKSAEIDGKVSAAV